MHSEFTYQSISQKMYSRSTNPQVKKYILKWSFYNEIFVSKFVNLLYKMLSEHPSFGIKINLI